MFVKQQEFWYLDTKNKLNAILKLSISTVLK